MNPIVKQLLQLQEIDKIADQLNLSLESFPLSIEEKRSLIKKNQELMEENKNKLVGIQLKRKEKEMELSSQEDLIRKHEKELNSIKSNEAYKALLNEIGLTQKQKSLIEDEILTLMEENDQVSVELKERENETKNNRQKLEFEIRDLEGQIEKTKMLLDTEIKKRESFVDSLPKDSLSKYDYIRQRKRRVVIVSIEGDTCSGCNTTLTQSVMNEVKKEKEIVVCDSCSRILYMRESEIPSSVSAEPVLDPVPTTGQDLP